MCDKASADATALIASGQLARDVASMIQSVKVAAPNAKVVVTGYPYLYDPSHPQPGRSDVPIHLQGHPPGQRTKQRDRRRVAAERRTSMLGPPSPATASNSATHDPWINLDLAHPTSPDNFHPNAEGYKAYFASLNKVNAYSAP